LCWKSEIRLSSRVGAEGPDPTPRLRQSKHISHCTRTTSIVFTSSFLFYTFSFFLHFLLVLLSFFSFFFLFCFFFSSFFLTCCLLFPLPSISFLFLYYTRLLLVKTTYVHCYVRSITEYRYKAAVQSA